MKLQAKVALLDIEGTTSSVSFVHEVLFPFARRELSRYFEAHWGEPALARTTDLIAIDAGYANLNAWCGSATPAEQRGIVQAEIERQMDRDAKATGLKDLQGAIWKQGFESGELKAHVYDDVPTAIAKWRQAGLSVRIYSSGSIAAQKLFFGHSIFGNMLPSFDGHYDTTYGSKREAPSYTRIASEIGVAPSEIVFVSDLGQELEAAQAVGMQVVLSNRPGNSPVASPERFPGIRSFAEIDLVKLT